MPDHPEGFTRPREGQLSPDASLAELYRAEAKEERVVFGESVQLLLIDESQIASEKQHFRLLFAATESTHIHTLVRWDDDRLWLKLRSSIKTSYTKRLNRELGQCTWFSERASRRHITDANHFAYLNHEYLPSHRGWKWSEDKGLFK